jgi:hypothetical protein
MPGATIDHLISATLFLVAILLFISLFSQNLQAALLYQRNHQISVKASDLLDAITLNTGYPTYWGASNTTPTSFGLQDPSTRGYHLSPFSLMRLTSSTGAPVYYPKRGLWYSNVTMGPGGFLLVPYSKCVNYTAATQLLGISGSYGFQLTVNPILKISMTDLTNQTANHHLRISVNVAGPGLPLANAYLSYNLIFTNSSSKQQQYPVFNVYPGDARTYANGSAILDFPSIIGTQNAYSLIVNARLGGLYGVGYFEHQYLTADPQAFIIPMVESFDNGNGTATILLAHSYNVPPNNQVTPRATIFYNATFLTLATDAALHPIFIGNGTVTDKVNNGNGDPYGQVLIPNTNPGILVITFRLTGNDYGISLLPWGIGNLAVSLTYGPNPSVKDWVATDVRQVVVAGVSYQIKIALWSLAGYQVQGSRWVF